MVKLFLDKGHTLDYVMSLDVYGWMLHLGCMMFDLEDDEGKEGAGNG